MGDDGGSVRAVVTALGGVLVAAILLLLLVVGLLVGLGMLIGTAADVVGSPPSSDDTGDDAPADTEPPETTFELDPSEDDGVVIEHVDGDPIVPEELFFELDGEQHGSWADVDPDANVVHQGDTVTLEDVGEGQEVRVIWATPETTVELFRASA